MQPLVDHEYHVRSSQVTLFVQIFSPQKMLAKGDALISGISLCQSHEQ